MSRKSAVYTLEDTVGIVAYPPMVSTKKLHR